MKRSSTLIKHRRNGVAVFKDYSAPQDPAAPTKSPRSARYIDREALSPLDTNNIPPCYSPQIPVAKSLEGRVVGEGTTNLDQKMSPRVESFGEEVEEEGRTNIEAALNEALTWLGGPITPLLAGLFDLPKPKESPSHDKKPPIINELIVGIDELLDEIQDHGLYQGHPDIFIDGGANESFSHCDSNSPDTEYEEGDGCALSLLELGTPLPPLPLKWSQAIMEVQSLVIRLTLTVEPY